MPRQPRIEIPGGFYHVGTRGNNSQAIYFGNETRRLFLSLLAGVARRYGWRVYAYCLMTNHYHLVVQIADAGLSQGMCRLNGRYALMANGLAARRDHLFGERFWSAAIETDEYLLECCRYIVLNPERAGICDARQWTWSSHRAALGIDLPQPCLALGDLHRHFGSRPSRAVAAYADYVHDGRVRWQST
jgi:REP element-mobilizing transposase RayT